MEASGCARHAAAVKDGCRHNFSILTLNIESINAKFDELTIYIEELSKINFKCSVICLQETWLSDDVDLSIFQIAGYDCISQGKSCSKKGGLIIYIDNKFDSELVINLNTYKLGRYCHKSIGWWPTKFHCNF